MSSIDYMVIDSSMIVSWKTIIWKYIRLAFDFAFPFFATAAGLFFFILILKVIHSRLSSFKLKD